MAEIVILGVIGAIVAVAYGLVMLYATFGWIVATAIVAVYVTVAGFTSGAARRWEPKSDDDKAIYLAAAVALWPVFWIVLGVCLWFRALYRWGARE